MSISRPSPGARCSPISISNPSLVRSQLPCLLPATSVLRIAKRYSRCPFPAEPRHVRVLVSAICSYRRGLAHQTQCLGIPSSACCLLATEPASTTVTSASPLLRFTIASVTRHAYVKKVCPCTRACLKRAFMLPQCDLLDNSAALHASLLRARTMAHWRDRESSKPIRRCAC